MAITTPKKQKAHIHDLAVAAKKIAKEGQERQATDTDIKFDFGHNVKPEGPKKVQ
jgi:hypothetical protein